MVVKCTWPDERRPDYDLLSLQRSLAGADASSTFCGKCDRLTCRHDRERNAADCRASAEPVLVCDAAGTIVDVHRCGSNAEVASLAGLAGRPFACVFGLSVLQKINEAFLTGPRVTLTAYLFDDNGLLLRTEMCCWDLRDAGGAPSGMTAMLHEVLAMEEFERRLGARITRLLEKNLALEGALASHRCMEG